MRAHLDAGCALCAKAVSLLAQVKQFADAELSRAVPPELSASAVALFLPVTENSTWAEKLDRLAATLVWELRPDLLPHGVRSAAAAGHRVFYRAGDYSVDFNAERMAGDAGEIIGQIVNESDQQESMDGILVQVVTSGRTVVETATNRFGEFIIEYPAGKNSVLRFALRDRGQKIEVPLHE